MKDTRSQAASMLTGAIIALGVAIPTWVLAQPQAQRGSRFQNGAALTADGLNNVVNTLENLVGPRTQLTGGALLTAAQPSASIQATGGPGILTLAPGGDATIGCSVGDSLGRRIARAISTFETCTVFVAGNETVTIGTAVAFPAGSNASVAVYWQPIGPGTLPTIR